MALSVHERLSTSLQLQASPHQSQPVLKEALDTLSMALEHSPDDSELQALAAELYWEYGQNKQAKLWADKVLSKENAPKTALRSAHKVLGHLADDAANPAQAVDHWQQLGWSPDPFWRLAACHLRRQPGKEPRTVQNTLMSVVYGCLFGLSLLGHSKQWKSYGPNATIVAKLLWLALKTNKQAEAYLSGLQALYHQYPGSAMLSTLLAETYMSQGFKQEAEVQYVITLGRHPNNSQAMRGLVTLYQQQENYPAAFTLLKRLLDKHPNEGSLHASLGSIYLHLGELRHALDSYKQALMMTMDSQDKVRLCETMATIYQQQLNNPEAAESVILLGLSHDPNNQALKLKLSIVAFEHNQLGLAGRACESLLETEENHVQAAANLGYLRWMEGDIETAIRLYEQAVEVDPSYDVACNNLGVLYLDHQGNASQAIERFKQATTLNESYTLAHYNLGRAYSMQNKHELAAASFHKANELNKETMELDPFDLDERLHALFQV